MGIELYNISNCMHKIVGISPGIGGPLGFEDLFGHLFGGPVQFCFIQNIKIVETLLIFKVTMSLDDKVRE